MPSPGSTAFSAVPVLPAIVHREVAEHGRGRAERRVRRLEQTLPDDLERAGSDVDLLRRGRGGMRRGAAGDGLLDVEEQVRRHELAAVRDQRVEARHLQRRDEQVLLSDRELDRVARLPELVDLRLERLLPPLGRRQQPAVPRARRRCRSGGRSRSCSPTPGADGRRSPAARRTRRRAGRSTCRTTSQAPSAGRSPR